MTEIEQPTPTSDGVVSMNAATVYHERFVPSLFGQFPRQLLDRVDVGAADHVLDVGCGTGIVAAAAEQLVGEAGRVVGVDPNPAMLAVAETNAGGRIEWITGAAEALPFEPASFDVTVSQFALMFFADPTGALHEVARVLKPAGRFAVMTWAQLEMSPGFEVLVEVLVRHGCHEAAAELIAPYSIGTPGALASVVLPVFPDATIEAVAGTASFRSVEDFIDINLDGWTMDAMVDQELRESITAATRAEFSRFCADDGSVRFPAGALVAWG